MFEEAEIPEIFYSFDSKSPFERCIDCDSYLLDGHVDYFIEKAVKKYAGFDVTDVIFEYAICMPCAMQLHERMSTESRQSIEMFMMQNMRHEARGVMVENNPDQSESSLEECLITGLNKSDVEEFQIFAHCRGEKLLVPAMPYMISGKALDQMTELLSDKTLDEMDGFIGKHFGPPGDFEVNPTRRVILV